MRKLRVLCGVVWLYLSIATIGCSSSGVDRIKTKGATIPLGGAGEERRFLILGLGLVSVNAPSESTSVSVVDQKSLGLYAGDQPGLKLGMGYQSSTVSTVPIGQGNTDVILEVEKRPFVQISVKTHQPKPYNEYE